MPLKSELREVIGALQSEVEFEAVVSELGAAGIDRARISYLTQEDIAASCAGAVGCDIKQLPRIDILERRPAAGSHTCDLARGDCRVVRRSRRRPGGDWRAAAPALLAGLASGGSVRWLAALFGQRHEGHVHEWAESRILNGGIVLIVSADRRGAEELIRPLTPMMSVRDEARCYADGDAKTSLRSAGA